MPLYEFRGRNKSGKLVQDTRDAVSEDVVYSELINSDIIPIEINEVKELVSISSQIRALFKSKKVSLDELSMFARQMYTLCNTGVPITLAFQQISEHTWNTRLQFALQSIADKLRAGSDLVDAMKEFPDVFSVLMIGMIRVGQNTGRLDEAFLHLNRYLEIETNTIKRLKTVLRYPLLVLLSILVAVGVITVFVIPKFAVIYENAHIQLPVVTQLLIEFSNFFINHWMLAFFCVLAVIFGIYTFIHSKSGKYIWHKYLLKLPVFGTIIKRIILLRFSQQFSITFTSGISVIESIDLVSQTIDNEYVSQKFFDMKTAIEHGNSVTQAASSINFFTPLELQMFAVGEQSGDLGNIFLHVADFYDHEVDYDLKKLSDIIQPLLIMVMSCLVLFLALAIYLPIWNMMSIVRH